MINEHDLKSMFMEHLIYSNIYHSIIDEHSLDLFQPIVLIDFLSVLNSWWDWTLLPSWSYTEYFCYSIPHRHGQVDTSQTKKSSILYAIEEIQHKGPPPFSVYLKTMMYRKNFEKSSISSLFLLETYLKFPSKLNSVLMWPRILQRQQ